MFEKYSYKVKFKVLLIVLAMLSIAAYRRSFSSLIESVKENQSLAQKVELMGKKTKNVDLLNAEIQSLDKLIGKENTSKNVIQQNIVGFITANSSKVVISDLKSIHEFTDENYKIFSYQLDLAGNFNSLIQLAYNFERKFDYSKIVSMKFYTEKKNNKSEVLHLKIIFQNYENNK